MSSDSHKKEPHGKEKPEAGAPEGKKSKKKLIIIGAVIALALTVIAAAVFFFVFKGKKKTDEGQHGAAEENREKEEKPKEGDKKGEAEKAKPTEKTFYPAIFFTERLTLPLAVPVKEGEETAKRLTRKKKEAEKAKGGQKFLLIRLAFEFENEEEKKAFEKIFPEVLTQLESVTARKNKDELVKFSEKIKLKLELSRIADRASNGGTKPKNIFFTDFTIQ